MSLLTEWFKKTWYNLNPRRLFAHDYNRERDLKDINRSHWLGNIWLLLAAYAMWLLLVSLVANWLNGWLMALWSWLHVAGVAAINNTTPGSESFSPVLQALYPRNFLNYANIRLNPIMWWIFEAIGGGVVLPRFFKTYYKHRQTRHLEYGNARFTTIDEIKKQYPIIADRGIEFDGYGGFPVAHLPLTISQRLQYRIAKWMHRIDEVPKGLYAIDQTTSNSLTVGKTRSGKDQTLGFPLIDILSRGEHKASIVDTDPKGEAYQESYELLRKRGYNVQVLNIQNTDYSMSYNPLQNAINYAKDGYLDKVQNSINSLCLSIYNDPTAKDKFWQETSMNLLSALILALMAYAKYTNDWEAVTMDNAMHLLTDMGDEIVSVDKNGDLCDAQHPDRQPTGTRNMLSVYFATLRKHPMNNGFDQLALDAFAQSNFAGEETAGNIYTSAMAGIQIYQQNEIAKLTSLNSIDFESIGFPRILKAKFDSSFARTTANVQFMDTEGGVLEERKALIDNLGQINYALEAKLPDEFKIKISFDFNKNPQAIQGMYLILTGQKVYERLPIIGAKGYKKDPYTGEKILKKITLKVNSSADHQLGNSGAFDFSKLELKYSEKPVALFLVTPPNNPSYNQLPAFMIDQIFNSLYEMALNNGRKVFNRTHFILNEFGNLPAIANMDTKLSIGAGQNLLFDIIVQNLEQLEAKYDKNVAATIQANCSILAYILTESTKTAELFSKQIGKQTVEVWTRSGQALNLNSINSSNQFTSRDLLSTNDLLNFQGGEMVVLRAVYRQDKYGNSIAALPIFDHGATAMPYAYTFLKKEFPGTTELADVAEPSAHGSLNLQARRVDWKGVLTQLNAESDQNDQMPVAEQATQTVETTNLNPETVSYGATTPIDSEPSEPVNGDDAEEFREPDLHGYIQTADEMPDDPIVEWEQLQNQPYCNEVLSALQQTMAQLVPEVYKAQVEHKLFDDTQDWFRYTRHNSWSVINEWLENNSSFINQLMGQIEQIDQRYAAIFQKGG